MFGPDLCSYDVSRIHLIFNKGGENLLKKDEIKLECLSIFDLIMIYYAAGCYSDSF
eukprot:SAG31_NODE_23522_length_502_cov_1.136476_2_plen_56_part_00